MAFYVTTSDIEKGVLIVVFSILMVDVGQEGMQSFFELFVLFPVYSLIQLDSFCTLTIIFNFHTLELYHKFFTFCLVLDLTGLLG